jgi:hypothetical protein
LLRAPIGERGAGRDQGDTGEHSGERSDEVHDEGGGQQKIIVLRRGIRRFLIGNLEMWSRLKKIGMKPTLI